MSIILNDNLQVRANKPTDDRYGPWSSVTFAEQSIPQDYRFSGLTVGIKTGSSVVEYWYESGITTGSLVLKTGQGSSGDVTYTNANGTSQTLGGIPQGTTFNNKTMKEMWDMLLYPYLTPSFATFSNSLLDTEYELGQPIVVGSPSFTWTTNNSSFVSAGTISIYAYTSTTNTNTVLLASGLTTSPRVTATTVALSTTAATTALKLYKITGSNTTGGTMTALDMTRPWRTRWFWGWHTGDTISISQITGGTEMNSELRTSVINSYKTFTTPNSSSYAYWVIPTAYTQPIVIYNNTSGCGAGSNIPFDLLMTTGITNQYGVTTGYKVYKMHNPTAEGINGYLCTS